jgi:hypothetical protein
MIRQRHLFLYGWLAEFVEDLGRRDRGAVAVGKIAPSAATARVGVARRSRTDPRAALASEVALTSSPIIAEREGDDRREEAGPTGGRRGLTMAG